MSDQRCPRCGAVRRPGDQWCGLCYADFRERPPEVVGDGAHLPPAPEGAPPAAPAPGADGRPLIRPPDQPGAALPPVTPTPAQPVPAIPAQPSTPTAGQSATPFVPSANPLAPAAALPTQLPAGVPPAAGAAPTEAGPDEAAPDPAKDLKWPCPTCGALAPMSEDNCPACGAGFLAEPGGNLAKNKGPLGDITKMNSGQKLALGLAVAGGIIVGMLALLAVGGTIFK